MRITSLLVLAFLLIPCGLEAAPPRDVVADWLLQDKLPNLDAVTKKAVADILDKLGPAGADLRGKLDDAELAGAKLSDIYLQACELRRKARLAPHRDKLARIVFTKHYDLGGSHYAYTEGQSDAQAERHFRPGTALCVLEMAGLYGRVKNLIEDPRGVIRDPDVSYDGKRILFSWKKDDRKDDYHLYEMDVATSTGSVQAGSIRQLTHGLGYADYEGAYLPNGDIVFNSTRCVQIVDCWWTEVSNLYTCGPDGRHLRRLSFDQVHTNYPQVLEDGRVIYTRWDYNDRGQIYPQPLYQMNADGTGQTELYGNNSWFPTTIMHSRGIPGSKKIICVLSGHHSHQRGKLAIIDTTRGRQEADGVQLIAPVQETKAVRVDAYGQNGDQFQYPFALSETAYLVTYHPNPGGNRRYKSPMATYFMTIDGERELLVSDPKISCNQALPLAPRKQPHVRPSTVDYRKKTGTYYVQDVYIGPGLEGIERGVVKRLRVVALEFRAAGIGSNGSGGPGGGALVSTPVSIGNGTWDVKKVLGSVAIEEDGSAFFTVPARTPVYFQLLDAKNHVVQSMRSWSTLQPGENFACVGCHEDKSDAPVQMDTIAARKGAQPLEPFYGPARGFSFPKEIQPILDKHCIRCHHLDKAPPGSAEPKRAGRAYDPKKMSMLVAPQAQGWRYTTKKPADNWTKPEFDDSKWKVGKAGFGTGGTPGARLGTRWQTNEIWLRRTFDLKAVPTAPAFLCHHDEDVRIYINGTLVASAGGYTTNYEILPVTAQCGPMMVKGKNTMAVSCRQTSGGQYIDVGVVETGDKPKPIVAEKPKAAPKPPPGVKPMFGLRSKPIIDTGAKRAWSESYLALTGSPLSGRGIRGRPNERVQWLNAQSIPPMLPPYFAGSARSKLITQLEEGHNGVKLSGEELDKIACWIDLLVPYCGDYVEANTWSDGEKAKHERYWAKRKAMEELDRANIEALLAGVPGPTGPKTDAKYRNVALNPNDVSGAAVTYPHASTNSEYNQKAFAAKCAVDGKTANKGHGGRFPSWGPHKRKDLWWKVEFGKKVAVDKIILYIRADFPHDRHWHSATVEFSDGTREKVSIRKTAEPQTFTFKERTVTWLRFTDLVQEEPLGWCGFSEVEVWGRDAAN